MYSRPEQLLEKYPLTLKTFSKGRECYLCDTSLGTYALREYRGSKERAAFLAEMFETFVAMVDEIILAERLVRQMGELAEGKLGLPDGNGLVRAKFGIGGTFDPVEF